MCALYFLFFVTTKANYGEKDAAEVTGADA